MSTDELDRLVAELKSMPTPPWHDFALMRALSAEPDPRMIMPEGVAVEPVDDNGIKGEWLVPEGAGDGVLFYAHGGGYCVCSPATHRHMIAALAKAAGVRAFSLDYRLAPEAPYPAAVEDAIRAANWLADGGADSRRTVFGGDSAGAGLVMATLISLRDRGERLPAGAIALCPWVDLSMSEETFARYKYDTPLSDGPTYDRGEGLRRFADAYLQGADGWNPLASPLFGHLGDLPPLYVLGGTGDMLVGEAQALADEARKYEVAVTLDLYDDMIHVWPRYWPMLSEGRDAIAKMAEFVRERTQGAVVA